MRIGIIVAMDKEFVRLNSLFESDADVCVVKSGIGKVNAALATQKLIDTYHPDFIISSGCAGGLSQLLNVGDVVVSEKVRYHDVFCGEGNELGQVQDMPAEFETNAALINLALACNQYIDVHIVRGKIASGDWLVTGDKVQDIIDVVPNAIAVDMESGAIAQVCHINNVKFVAFRVISDVPGKKDVDNLQQYADFWARLADNSFTVTKTFVDKLKTEWR